MYCADSDQLQQLICNPVFLSCSRCGQEEASKQYPLTGQVLGQLITAHLTALCATYAVCVSKQYLPGR